MTKREWIADCERKERHLRARKLATAEELALTRPGRRSAPLEQWIRHYAKLGQLLGRADQRALWIEHGEADTAVVAALMAEPLTLRLLPRDGAAAAVQVFPKSFDTLLHFFHVRDWLQLVLTTRYAAVREAANPVDADVLARFAAEISYQQRLLAWVACTPGPGLPAGVAGEWLPKGDRPEIPEPFATLDASDLLRIHDAWLRVNGGQLQALDRLVEAATNGPQERPAWSIFFAKLAMKLKVSAESLMRDHSLASLLATVKLAAENGGEDELEEGAA